MVNLNLKGWAINVKTFLGPETAESNQELFGPKKVETFMAEPFQWPKLPSKNIVSNFDTVCKFDILGWAHCR